MSFLLKVRLVANKLDRVNDALVIEEHTSDLSSGLSVLGLDESIDGVTDFLTSVVRVHIHEATHVNGGLLLHGLSELLVRGHRLSSRVW